MLAIGAEMCAADVIATRQARDQLSRLRIGDNVARRRAQLVIPELEGIWISYPAWIRTKNNASKAAVLPLRRDLFNE